MQPACAPLSRRIRVSRRVSISAIATVLPRFRKMLERVLGAPAAHGRREIADDQPGCEDLRRLEVVRVRADVADVRIREGDDLSVIRRVGEDFLVPGDRGVENHFAECPAFGSHRDAVEHRAVFER
jgi:hypothetical protein